MKFNLKRTLFCSLAFGWISLFWGSYDAIMQSINYDVFELNSVWHGVIIAADNILGLFLLPLFGRLSDKTSTPFGSRKPYIVAGTVISMVGFVGVCVFATMGKDYFLPFILCLLVTLAAMAAYRSPALALVPDVNPDRFRSVANAVSNVVSVIMTVVAMLYFYVFMMFDGYIAIGAAFASTTLVMMVVFCFTVHEKQIPRRHGGGIKAGGRAGQTGRRAQAHEQRDAGHGGGTGGGKDPQLEKSRPRCAGIHRRFAPSSAELRRRAEPRVHLPQKERKKIPQAGRNELEFRPKQPFIQSFCILAVVFCFYMTYNALTSNFVKYAEYILGFKQNEAIIPLILAQAAAMIAFPVASSLSNKIGRRNTMIIGFAIMVAAFSASIAFSSPHPILYVIFTILGVSFGFVMVNIYPFFLETSRTSKIGEDTGIFSMSMTIAMVITPILSGALIASTGSWFGGGENAGFRILFPYSVFFLVLALILTILIKPKKSNNKKKFAEVVSFD